MNNSLYKISNDYHKILLEIEYNDGLLTEELEQALAITESNLEKSALACREGVVKQEAMISAIDNEIKRLQALKKSKQSMVKSLNKMLLEAVERFGDFTIGTITFGKRKSSALEVDDVNLLPKEFKTIKVTEAADKMKLKNALKDGKEIKGVRVITNYHLKIK